MTLRLCRGCASAVSTAAGACPKCGVFFGSDAANKSPKRHPRLVFGFVSAASLAASAVIWSWMPAPTVISTPEDRAIQYAPTNPLMTGSVLPFRVLNAIRNHGFKYGMVPAQVSIAVMGGRPEDWAATAVYLARASMVLDATYAMVEVYIESPWGDRPPQRTKLLAKAFFAPIPGKAPWTEPFDLFVAHRAGTPAEIEWDELSDELSNSFDRISDPDKRQKMADAEATRIVVRKYHLSPKWSPSTIQELGTWGDPIDGRRVAVLVTNDAMQSLKPLRDCLTGSGGTYLLQGCPYDASSYKDALRPR